MEEKKVCKHKLVHNLFELCDHINKEEITKEDIVSIFSKDGKIAMIYYGK